MTLRPATPEAFWLLMKGAEAMTRIESHGICIDTDYLDKSIASVTTKIAELEQSISQDEVYKTWAKVYGNSMTLGSRKQLGRIIFDELGHERNKFMEQRNDGASFEHLKVPFIRNYQDIERLKKALSTNLLGLKNEVVDGKLHAFLDLHTVESYRSSSSRINLQNQPIRNKDISRIVRSCMIPRKNHVFLEPDMETHEVRISHCYNKDPKLKYDVLHGDMHTDRALDLYKLSPKELGNIKEEPGKTVRYIAKNRFVFAQFYGSYYAQCAPDLWDAIAIFDLKTAKGKSLFEHLESKGIKRLGACDPHEKPAKGTFEKHVQEVERIMWEENYKVYSKWKDDWWNGYVSAGGIHTLTGFTLEGVFRRNQILCDPIQGSAFHCLLWGIIHIVEELRKRKMRSKIVSQIHDSMLVDAHRNEIEDVINIIRRVMLVELPNHWKWINIPLSMGFDICEKNWFEKKEFDFSSII